MKLAAIVWWVTLVGGLIWLSFEADRKESHEYKPKSIADACFGIPQSHKKACEASMRMRYPELWLK
jgi:hypothetical protein